MRFLPRPELTLSAKSEEHWRRRLWPPTQHSPPRAIGPARCPMTKWQVYHMKALKSQYFYLPAGKADFKQGGPEVPENPQLIGASDMYTR